MTSGFINLKQIPLVLCLIWLPATLQATEKSVYGLNEYVLVMDIKIEVAAKLETIDPRQQERLKTPAERKSKTDKSRKSGPIIRIIG